MSFLKKSLVVVLMVLIPGTVLMSQVEKGDRELSAAASFAHISDNFFAGEGSFSTFRLAGRLGFFVNKKLEIEPEIILSKFGIFEEGGSKIACIFSLNLAHHFKPEKKTVSFLLAGLGIGNSIPFYHNVAIYGSDEIIMLLNAGAGLKLFLSKTAALRLEYRFQYYFDLENGYDNDLFYHYGLVGVSIFLKK